MTDREGTGGCNGEIAGQLRGRHWIAGRLATLAFVSVSLAWASPVVLAPTPQKRLAEWLIEQPFSEEAYPLGLSWRVPDEVPPQQARLLELLKMLSGAGVTAEPEAVGRLRNWLRTLPVTGRVRVPVADARWLQAKPARGPGVLPA